MDQTPRFSPQEVLLAREIHQTGVAWQPAPGQFVYDDESVLPHTSPFQDKVFFILDLKHFIRYAGSIEIMVQRMFWLPAWWDARVWLRGRGISDAKMTSAIEESRALKTGCELECLYELMLTNLRAK
jgi:hypothetical protein